MASPQGPIEQRTQAIGRELIARSRQLSGSQSLQDRLTEWALASQDFKVQLFRLIDVYPRLTTPEAIHAHAVQYLQRPGLVLPTGMNLAIGAGSWLKGAFAKTITSQVEATAGRFIAGRDFDDAWQNLNDDRAKGRLATIDLLGEAVLTESEAAAYQKRYLDLITAFANAEDAAGAKQANVSIKLSSLTPKFDALDFDGTIDRVLERLQPILDLASQRGVLINFDMESFTSKELILTIFQRACERSDFNAGIAIQAYLNCADDDVRRLIEWANHTRRTITVRLVKGAYWDHEVIHAQEKGWPCPVWLDKGQTDACFERLTDALLSTDHIRLALGSHNARSIAHGLAIAETRQREIEVQMLYGMADGLKAALLERSVPVREYIPVGDLAPGMAYLVRRLLENSSNQSWLLKGQDQQTPVDDLLKAPDNTKRSADIVRPDVDGFRNEPTRDFADVRVRERFKKSIEKTRPQHMPISATIADADRAVEVAKHAFKSWRDVDAQHRADLIRRAAQAMREHRDELAGIMVHEAQKPWREADVCEAIDFCEFYAMRAPLLFQRKRLGQYVGQRDEIWHEPRGVAVIISPWNFPLAICCGMTVASLVTGNCAIVKPAEQTPAIAKRLCEILWNAGIPRDVLHFLPGRGETVGAHLVRHPAIDLIAFTGSKSVGIDILSASSRVDETAGQSHVKRVVCEMGGKNAIIIDDTADLDEAVIGVRDSAFGYAGQKCSACSRVIVLPGIRDEFIARLVDATRHLKVDDATNPATDIPPVIDDEAARKIWNYVDLGKSDGRLMLGDDANGRSRFIPPHIFTGINENHRLFREEIFGPVLSITEAKDFDDAIRLALAVPYRLAGGVFSRTPDHLEQALREFRVGNLYLNRGITGALVGRQPFGGVGLSGTGTKAGGDEYLLNFVWPRVCSENTERRGFAPGMAE